MWPSCRILEDDVSNIIVPGDLVLTPAWAPGRQIHFAIAGFVDLTDDDKSDLDMLEEPDRCQRWGRG